MFLYLLQTLHHLVEKDIKSLSFYLAIILRPHCLTDPVYRMQTNVFTAQLHSSPPQLRFAPPSMETYTSLHDSALLSTASLLRKRTLSVTDLPKYFFNAKLQKACLGKYKRKIKLQAKPHKLTTYRQVIYFSDILDLFVNLPLSQVLTLQEECFMVGWHFFYKGVRNFTNLSLFQDGSYKREKEKYHLKTR